MKISIITATFNSENSLKATLNSLFNQDYNNIESIIIDGNSTDSTLGIVERFHNKSKNIKLISEPDDGIYDALNKGLALATGDLIGFVHSDDLLASSEVISELVSEIQNENLDGVYGDLQYVDKENTNKIIRFWKSCEFKPNLLREGWMPPHPTLFLKKEVYEKYGLFDLSFNISADYDFMLRVLNDSELKFGYLPKVITKMRVGGTSNRSLENIIKKTREDYRAIKINKIGNFLTLIRKNTSKLKQFF